MNDRKLVEGSGEVEKGYPKFVCDGGKGNTGVSCAGKGEDTGAIKGIHKGCHYGRVYINGDQYFGGVGADVWEFCVGGYQVCEKWLKDRRGRVLSYDDIEHYQRVVVSLGETIRVMGEIDGIIGRRGGWAF